MNDILMHVKWYDPKGNKGLVAVLVEGEAIEVHRLAGPAIKASHLYPLLRAALPEGWWEEAEKLHRTRKYPWMVEVNNRTSGAKDIVLRFLRDPRIGDQPIGARIHISMYDKLNEGLRMWAGDLPPLLEKLRELHPEDDELEVETFRPRLREGWHWPEEDL